MRLISTVVLLISAMTQTYALTCYDCDSYSSHVNDYMGECFNINTIRYNCTGAKYCETRFRLEDGITTRVYRGCGYEGEKTGEGWHMDNYYSNSRSTFVMYCNEKDVCNNDPPCGFKTCTRECINGGCNHIMGVCECYSGYKGDICNTTDATATPKIRKCHQCNSDYDGEACENEMIGDGSVCLNGENSCSISRVTLIDTDMMVRKNVTLRGCTDSTILFRCEFAYTSPVQHAPYLVHTCSEKCDTDSCNQKRSVELGNDKPNDLYCVQCSCTGGDCGSQRLICPYGTKHCISTVVYTISERYKLHNEGDPDYALLSVVRGCANESVIPECKEEQVAGVRSVKKVTCSETCEKDGCNDGWPTRPKCVICDSQHNDERNCDRNPPFPESCDKPYQNYCYIHDEKTENTTDTTSRYARRTLRDCSYYDRGSSCATTRNGDAKIESCNYTCTSDGCNVGSVSGGEIPLQTLLLVLLVALFAILQQKVN